MTDTAASVELVPFPAHRFPAFRDHLARDYADDKVKAGVWSSEEAQARAEADVDGLLPEGTQTTDHYLHTVQDASTLEEVGTLWLALREQGGGRVVWVYDIEIFTRFRRRGYGTMTLKAVEVEARRLGADRVELQVFGHNAAARSLYERLGYVPTSIVLSKPLGDPDP